MKTIVFSHVSFGFKGVRGLRGVLAAFDVRRGGRALRVQTRVSREVRREVARRMSSVSRRGAKVEESAERAQVFSARVGEEVRSRGARHLRVQDGGKSQPSRRRVRDVPSDQVLLSRARDFMCHMLTSVKFFYTDADVMYRIHSNSV